MDSVENAAEENRRLRRTMRDLVALSTLPAVWIGLGPEGIARSLADVLLNTLSLDFVYVRLTGRAGRGRGRSRPQQALPDAAHVEAVRAALAPLLDADQAEPPATIPDPFGDGTLHVAVTRFGVSDDQGVLVTGSRSADFPTEQDRLLLGVGANQTAIVVQRRRAEEQVHEQREWLRVTLASIGDAVIATDTEGRVTFLNAVAQELTGWTQDDAEGQPLETVFAILNEQTRQPVENPVEKVLREGVIVGLANHTVLIAKDGTERPIDDSCRPDPGCGGQVDRRRADLPGRDRAASSRAGSASRARPARARFWRRRSIASSRWTTTGKVVEFNPAAEKTFGYRREQVIGQELCQFIIPPSLRERHRNGMAHYLATGEGPVLGKRLELPALRADGTEFPVELAITRISTDGPPLFTAYLRDITEQKRAEQHRNVRLAVTQALSEAANVDEGASGVLRSVCENLGWDVGFFWNVNDEGDRLVCRASWHRPDVTVTEFETASCSRTFEKGEGLPGRVWASRQTGLDTRRRAGRQLPTPRRCHQIRPAQRLRLSRHRRRPDARRDRVLHPDAFGRLDADLLETMGTVAGNVGQFIERKTAEDELRRSEQELADFFENATVGLHWVGRGWNHPAGQSSRTGHARLQPGGVRRSPHRRFPRR